MDTRLIAAALVLVTFIAVGCSKSPRPQLLVDADATVTPATPAVETRAQATVTVPVSAPVVAPRLSITPQPAAQSGQVQVSGDGFAPGETVVIASALTADPKAEQLTLGSAVAASDGSFQSSSVLLPDQLQSGAHPLQVAGQTSGRTGTAMLWIRAPQPWLVLDNYDIPQNGDMGFVAGGFEPMDQVTVSVEPPSGAAVQLVVLTTDQAGNAQWSQLKLPRLASGTYMIVLKGSANGAELRREMRVTPLKPVIELSPWAGPPGVPVQFNARGFAPSEQIHVRLGDAQDPTVLQADDYGNLWGAGPVHVPQTASKGEMQLRLTGAESGAVASATFKVLEPKPWLELTNWSGAPGAPVGFGGGGWIGGEKVTIHLGSATAPAQAVAAAADENGWLKSTGQVYIPNDVADDVILVAVGEQSHLAAAATFRVVFPFGLHPQADGK
jgi:hypothetical protein